MIFDLLKKIKIKRFVDSLINNSSFKVIYLWFVVYILRFFNYKLVISNVLYF